MLMGGILSATDPVAVLGVLKSLGAPEKLNLIIGGESLLNDGTAVVVFWIFRDLVAECSETDFGTVLGRFLVLAVGGVAWGFGASHLKFSERLRSICTASRRRTNSPARARAACSRWESWGLATT